MKPVGIMQVFVPNKSKWDAYYYTKKGVKLVNTVPFEAIIEAFDDIGEDLHEELPPPIPKRRKK